MGIEILYILIFKGSLINHILQIPVFFPLDLIVAKWNVLKYPTTVVGLFLSAIQWVDYFEVILFATFYL